MLHNFGGANGMFGPLNQINKGPDEARKYTNSSMMGIGITMEGINQNEFLYEFVLEKSWRSVLNEKELSHWIEDFTIRRYSSIEWPVINQEFHSAWILITSVVYNTGDHQWKQLFTKRPSLYLTKNNVTNVGNFYLAWDKLVEISYQYQNSDLLNYDLVDISKEALTLMFAENYEILVRAWHSGDLYLFSEKSSYLINLLNDLEVLLATDSRFLLGKWLADAKTKGTNFEERELYEWNARTQVTLWGENSTTVLFDYACKAWSGLVQDYYIPRWKTFFSLAEKALLRGKQIDPEELNIEMLTQAELPFISSRKEYPATSTGGEFSMARRLNSKYRSGI